jgi:hypothetical protein
MAYSRMIRRVALVRTDVSEELNASFIRVTRVGEIGTTLAVTSNRRTLRRNQESHGVTSQKTQVFIVTAVKTSNLTFLLQFTASNFGPNNNAFSYLWPDITKK